MAGAPLKSAPPLYGIARNPAPSGARVGAFIAEDGVVIRYAVWERTASRRNGTVCLFSGRGEFIEKYFETITDLRRRGFAVVVMDWRGQGGSDRLLADGAKGHVEDFADYDADLRRFMETIVLPDCPAPYYGMGMSMGGHLLLRTALTRVCWFDRLILVAPMVDVARRLWSSPGLRLFVEGLALAGLGDAYRPGGHGRPFELRPFADNHLTSDRRRYERIGDILRAAPQLGIGSPTVAWIAAAARSVMRINHAEFLSAIKVPILIVAAGHETVVSLQASERLSRRLRGTTHLVIAGARHEILQERDIFREQFWAAFDAYMPGSNRTLSPGLLGL